MSRRTGREVYLEGEDRFRGLLVTGGIGSGKTEGFMKPILRQIILDPERPGALVLNCKDAYGDVVRRVAEEAGQKDRVIVLEAGGRDRMNLLAPWLPGRKLAASLFSAVQPIANPYESFWIQSGTRALELFIEFERAAAEAFARIGPVLEAEAAAARRYQDALEIVLDKKRSEREQGSATDRGGEPVPAVADKAPPPRLKASPPAADVRVPPPSAADVTMVEIRHLIGEMRADLSGPIPSMSSSIKARLKAIRKYAQSLPAMDPIRARIEYEASGFDLELRSWLEMDERPKTSIEAEVSRVTMAFRPWEIAHVLCAPTTECTFDGVRAIAEEGKIVVVDFPPQRDGLIGKVVNTMLKRQFFSWLVNARGDGRSRSKRPCFFIADEFQNFLTLDESEDADHCFAAIARSLRCGVVIATQEIGALDAAAGPHGRAAFANFLRNLRTHVYLRQNRSAALESALAERGVGKVTSACVTALQPFQALVVQDGTPADVVQMKPDFARGRPAGASATPDGTCGSRRALLERVRHAVAKKLEIPVLATGDLRQLVAADAPDVVRAVLDAVEDACHRAGIPIARLEGSSLDRVDPALRLADVSGYRSDHVAAGVIIIDRLDSTPRSDAAAESLRRLLEDARLDAAAPGFRFDYSTCWIVASAMATRTGQKRFGFSPLRDEGAPKIARWCLDRMETIWVGCDRTESPMAGGRSGVAL